jgi:hypothetical protein
MNTYKNPNWWTKDHDSSWERVKAAFKRDWDQTKHDLGGDKPDTNQNAADTVKQAAGSEAIPPRGVPAYDKAEPAYRFGYGARSHYGKKYPTWNPALEEELRRDWSSSNSGQSSVDWESDSKYIRSGWDYQK